MRLAHLILAHTNPEQLSRLIGRLTHDGSDIYVHVDLKTDITPFLPIKESWHVFFIRNRIKVNWAGYSQVQSIVNGFKEILGSGKKYDYINLLSGQDYPIKSTKEIHDFLANNPGKAFMHTLKVREEWQEAILRLEQYHLSDHQFPGKYSVERVLNKVLPKRKMPDDIEVVGRSSWFTISTACAKYIIDFLEKKKSFTRFFKLSWGADEIVFQTILYNSPFKKDIVNDNLLYVDWSEGGARPKILTMADAAALSSSDKLFARKFSPEVDSDILDHLDKTNSLT